jgi:hypothetical protein
MNQDCKDLPPMDVSLVWGWPGGCVPVLGVAGWMCPCCGGGRVGVSMCWGCSMYILTNHILEKGQEDSSVFLCLGCPRHILSNDSNHILEKGQEGSSVLWFETQTIPVRSGIATDGVIFGTVV